MAGGIGILRDLHGTDHYTASVFAQAAGYWQGIGMLMDGDGDTVLLAATPRQKPRLEAIAQRWPLDGLLAALQILAEARGRMRGSPHGRLLLELALVKVARLEDLGELSGLVARLSALESGTPSPSPSASPSALKKKPVTDDRPAPAPAPTPRSPSPPTEAVALPDRPSPSAREPSPTPASVPASAAPPSPASIDLPMILQAWPGLIRKIGVRLGVPLSQAERFLAISGPNTLAIRLPAGYNGAVRECDSPETIATIETSLSALIRVPVSVRFEHAEGTGTVDPRRTDEESPTRRRDEMESDPLVRKVVELFEARPLHLEYDDEPR
jgi:DNA polymerase-3 subunit gamma/tau